MAAHELSVGKDLLPGLLSAQRGRLGGSLEEIKAGVCSDTLATELYSRGVQHPAVGHRGLNPILES